MPSVPVPPTHVTNGYGFPMQTASCTWPYVVPVGEDPAAHGHWCAFTDLYHTMPCHAMPTLIHVRATTREAARPQLQDSEDTTGYWAADSLSSSPYFSLPPLHLLCLLVTLMGHGRVPSKNLLPHATRVASGVRCVHSAWPPLSADHGPVHLNSPANTYYQTRPVITMTPF